jgi:HEAT repeat protein
MPKLSTRQQVALVGDLWTSLAPAQRERLEGLVDDWGLVTRAERWCRSRRWWRRLHGARLLALVGRGEHVVPRLFDDPHPDVRAQAAAWAADWPLPHVIDRLIDMLGDPRNVCRFTVKDSLLRVRGAAVEPLAQRITCMTGLALREALVVAAHIADTRLLPAALDLAGHDDADVRSAAAAVLGAIGGSEGIERLGALLADRDAGVRASAARGLGHLGHWPAAAPLAGLLGDAAWDVRRAAALALRELGAPGALLLRRALSHEDRFVRDMARQTLDVPAVVEIEAFA